MASITLKLKEEGIRELRKSRLIRSLLSNRVGLLVKCDLKITSLSKGDGLYH
jgi:hypothetical protein